MSEFLRPETITIVAEGEFAHRKIYQDSNRAEFAFVKLRLEPLPRHGGIQYVAESAARVHPDHAAGLKQGIDEALMDGVLNRGMVVDIKVVVLDAKYHHIDSNHKTFRIAAQRAFEIAMRQAGPIFL
jgi:elongation factor G